MNHIKQISVVCYGNIARSQILGIYLNEFLKIAGFNDIEVYSAGTAPYETYPETPRLIKEVEDKLREIGINAKPERTPWSDEVRKKLELSDIILVADEERKKEVIERLDDNIPKYSIYTFYEFIDEGEKDFEDTYDYEKRCQDPLKFERSFNELGRIARKIVVKLQHDL